MMPMLGPVGVLAVGGALAGSGYGSRPGHSRCGVATAMFVNPVRTSIQGGTPETCSTWFPG